MTIDELVKKYQPDLAGFELAINEYHESFRVFFSASDAERMDESFESVRNSVSIAHVRLSEKFSEMLSLCAKEARLKEEFEIILKEPDIVFPQSILRAKTSGISIKIDEFDGFRMITDLIYPNNFGSLNDEFWKLMFKLEDCGKFSYVDCHYPNSRFSRKYPQLFNKRGSIYKMQRKFMLNMIEYGHCNYMGCFIVEWKNETNIKELVWRYCETFKLMYKLNYMLYQEEIKKTKRFSD